MRAARAGELVKRLQPARSLLGDTEPESLRISPVFAIRGQAQHLVVRKTARRQHTLLGGGMDEAAHRPTREVDGSSGSKHSQQPFRGISLTRRNPFPDLSSGPSAVDLLDQAPGKACLGYRHLSLDAPENGAAWVGFGHRLSCWNAEPD